MTSLDNLLRYVERRTPGTLQTLRQRYPEEASLLTPRLELGPGDDAPAAPAATPPALIAIAETSAVGLREELDELMRYVVGRLRLGSRIRTGGAVVSTLAGLAAAALAFVGAGDRAIALSTATFAALGGLASLGAGTLEKSPLGVRVSLTQDVTRLTALVADVEQMQRVLARQRVIPLDAAQCHQMVERLDIVYAEVRRLWPESVQPRRPAAGAGGPAVPDV